MKTKLNQLRCWKFWVEYLFIYLKLHNVYKELQQLFLDLGLCIIFKDPHESMPPIKAKSHRRCFTYDKQILIFLVLKPNKPGSSTYDTCIKETCLIRFLILCFKEYLFPTFFLDSLLEGCKSFLKILNYYWITWHVEKSGLNIYWKLHNVYEELKDLFQNLGLWINLKDPHESLPPIRTKSHRECVYL